MYIILQTPRLIIREFLPEEEDIYLDHFSDEEVTRYTPKRSREERIKIFRTALAAYDNSKQLGIWSIFNKEDDKVIGSCLLRSFADAPEKTELGYGIQRKYWNKGIGTEMVKAMVGYAFINTPLVVAVTDLENIGSQRVLEKAGFKRMDNLSRGEETLAYFEISR
jgi:[ribosomal protein S5]-alanine N-acetyltransferase